jgi:hypothetical protein
MPSTTPVVSFAMAKYTRHMSLVESDTRAFFDRQDTSNRWEAYYLNRMWDQFAYALRQAAIGLELTPSYGAHFSITPSANPAPVAKVEVHTPFRVYGANYNPRIAQIKVRSRPLPLNYTPRKLLRDGGYTHPQVAHATALDALAMGDGWVWEAIFLKAFMESFYVLVPINGKAFDGYTPPPPEVAFPHIGARIRDHFLDFMAYRFTPEGRMIYVTGFFDIMAIDRLRSLPSPIVGPGKLPTSN